MLKLNKIKTFLIILSLTALFSCGGSLEEEVTLFKGQYVEIDAAVLNPLAAGKNFPLLSRQPLGGRPVISTSNPSLNVVADPLISRTSGVINLRVNLVAAQRPNAEDLTYRIVSGETTAEEGVHYKVNGTVQIPANSSFGNIQIEILNPGAGAGNKIVVLELESSATLKANPNYNKVGISISQI